MRYGAVEVSHPHLKQDLKRRRLDSNAGPNPQRQKTTRDEHEIDPADSDGAVVHDSSRVPRRAALGRNYGGIIRHSAGDMGITGDADAAMNIDPLLKSSSGFDRRPRALREGGHQPDHLQFSQDQWE